MACCSVARAVWKSEVAHLEHQLFTSLLGQRRDPALSHHDISGGLRRDRVSL